MKENISDTRLFIALLAVLIIIFAVFIYALDINRNPDSFTQAWLEEYPSEAHTAEEFGFSFVINSHEAAPTTYNYTITSKLEGSDKVKTHAHRETNLEPDETKTRTHKITLEETGQHQVLITIEAEGKENPYELWFWVRVDAPEEQVSSSAKTNDNKAAEQ